MCACWGWLHQRCLCLWYFWASSGCWREKPWSASSPPLVLCPAPWSQQRFPSWTWGRFANLMCIILLNWLEGSPKKHCLTLHPGDYTQVFRHMSAPVRTSLRKLFAEHGKAAKTTSCIDMENLQLRSIPQSEPLLPQLNEEQKLSITGLSLKYACAILCIVYAYMAYLYGYSHMHMFHST